MFDLTGKKVWVSGHRGMVGSALVRRLAEEKCDVVTAGRELVDLTSKPAVEAFVSDTKPDIIIMAAAKVGGILANDTYPVDFLHENLLMEVNVFNAAHQSNVDKLLFLGSSCIYPKHATQPIQEDALLTGPLEPTNEWYAVAKIAGIKLAQAYRKQYNRRFISAMPTNLYGPNDNFDLKTSHVLPALIRKAHEAKENGDKSLEIWGTGKPRREFLHVDDCANALVFLLKNYDEYEHVNIGCGDDLSIANLVQIICKIVGFKGEIIFDLSKPDGTPRKLMSIEKLTTLGWQPKISLEDGISCTYEWFKENLGNIQVDH